MGDKISRKKAMEVLQKMADLRCNCSRQQLVEKKTLELAVFVLTQIPDYKEEEDAQRQR